MIIVVDFGSQTTHLISRRVADFGIQVKIIEPDVALEVITAVKPAGIIFSGGPASVYERHAPTVSKTIYTLGIPILGICYGQQLTAHLLGGKVKPGKTKEFGPAALVIDGNTRLFSSLSTRSRVWMSHGDVVASPPLGFSFVGNTETVAAAAMTHEKRRIYCVQFHPEVEHTEHGALIFKNFLDICGLSAKQQSVDIEAMIKTIKKTVGSKKAIAAVSGGLDSTVSATLVARAIGKQLIPVHIENGLMRKGTTQTVVSYFRNKLGINPIVLSKEKEFLKVLKGKTDPEEKRKAIGKLYIELFEKELKNHTHVEFLVQGTIYSDVIESKGTRYAANIKSHHNIGGLPKRMKLILVEPIRELYTDQVRSLAKRLRIPRQFISQQPHPGPGYAIRIIGEVTKERLVRVCLADAIIVEEVNMTGWYEKLLHSFAVATGIQSTAVKGDGRGLGEVIAVRAVVSRDRMTADWAKLPDSLLQKISSRIVNEVPGVSRVVYDITTKPPATMEWE